MSTGQQIESACREFRCPYCNAEPGKPCVTLTSGFDRREVHADRFNEALGAGRVRWIGRGFDVSCWVNEPEETRE